MNGRSESKEACGENGLELQALPQEQTSNPDSEYLPSGIAVKVDEVSVAD